MVNGLSNHERLTRQRLLRVQRVKGLNDHERLTLTQQRWLNIFNDNDCNESRLECLKYARKQKCPI